MREPKTEAGFVRDTGADDVALVVRIGTELLALWEAPGDRRLVPSVLPADQSADGRNGAERAAPGDTLETAGMTGKKE